MEPWTWIAIAAVVLVVVAAAAGVRRRRAPAGPAVAEDEKQLREARRWQEIEAARAHRSPRRRPLLPVPTQRDGVGHRSSRRSAPPPRH